MSRATGTLSPPPRAPSPNPPRPSISSNRSARRTGADFEAALLDPKAIIFLSDTPTLGEKIGSGSPPRKVDHDAPQPVEKRSFEEDMNELTVTPVKQVGTPMNQVGVIPPTPATMALERKVSGGGESFTPIKMLVASRKTGPSLGIDGVFPFVPPHGRPDTPSRAARGEVTCIQTQVDVPLPWDSVLTRSRDSCP